MGFDIAPYGQAIAEVGSLLNGILKRVLPEKMSELEKAQIQQQVTLELMKADLTPVLSQLEINKVEAGSERLFVSGWRPNVGWVCGAALAYAFIAQPFLVFAIQVTYWMTKAPAAAPFPVPPTLDIQSLMTILLGLLGLGGMRTFEKVKGASGKGS